MKKLILSIVSLLLTIAGAFAQGDVTFDVSAPTAVETGTPFRVEFVIGNASPQQIKFTPPAIEGFELLAGPSESYGADISISGGETVRTETTTYTFVIRGVTPGLHTVQATTASVSGKVYSTRAVTIEVVEPPEDGVDRAAEGQGSGYEISDNDVFLRATVDRTDVYKDEPIVVTLKLYVRNIQIANLDSPKFPAFNGFWQQDISSGEPTRQRETYNNRVYETSVLKEYLLYPQQSGIMTVESFEATVNAIFQEQTTAPRSIFDDFIGQNIRQVSKRIASQPIRIEVRDWPAGAPASFDGAVGEFRLEVTPPPSAMNANQSGTYTLRLSGMGNFPLIRVPKISLPQSFEQYNVTTSDNTRHSRVGTSGYREFSYPFIPRSDGLYTIPAFEFTYFDPQQRRYITHLSRETSIEVAADSTAWSGLGGVVSGVSREELRIFDQDIQFIKRGSPGLRPKGRTFLFSPLYTGLLALFSVVFVVCLLVLPRYLRNMQSDRFVRGKRANKVAFKRFRAAETYMKRDDRHGFYDEMFKALWGYMSDKFDIPMADLTKERIREELFVRNILEDHSLEYVRIISDCEEAQYSPVSSSRMGEIYREGVALISKLESALK
ncbi:MAG: BatD family protein [Alistipes sp.]|nr:BatD family protein [Alistipes sp.]